MFCFTKVVKLVGLFRKNPSDIVYLPVSILFGYFHGLIKLYALFTLKHVSYTTNSSTSFMPQLLTGRIDILGQSCRR